MTASFTLGPSWVDQYVSSMMLLHALMGHPANAQASRPTTPESIIRTLQQIAHGQYVPEQGPPNGSPDAPEFTLAPPALAPSQNYLVIVLNASTPTSDFASVDAGGVIFEDPAWAVFAAHAIAQAPRFEQDPRVGVPLASDQASLWRGIGLIQQAILSQFQIFGARLLWTRFRFYARITARTSAARVSIDGGDIRADRRFTSPWHSDVW